MIKSKSGFTIVELLVVIVVIGILAAITIVSYTGISSRASVASIISDLKNASTQLELDRTYTDQYPITKELAADGAGLKSSPGTTYSYTYNSSNNSYCLLATNANGVSYYINSVNKAPTIGVCPITSIAVAWGGAASDTGKSVVQTSDGGYAVAGNTLSFGAGLDDMFLAKYAYDGTLTWSKTWGGAGSDYGNALVQTSDGGYAVTGQTNSYGAGGYDMFLVKFNSDGSLSWNKIWGSASGDYGRALIQTSDNGYAVTGYSGIYVAGGDDMFLAKYASDGTLSWSKTWGGTSTLGDYGNALVQTSDGGFAVAGDTYSYGSGTNNMFIAKYTSVGNLSWSRTWGGATISRGRSIVQTSDDGYAITGQTDSFGAGLDDVFLAKYDSSGSLSWDRTWGGAGAEQCRSVAQTSDSGYVVTGQTNSYGAGNYDMLIAKFISDGTFSWAKTWGGTGSDYSYSLAKNSDNGYVITGYTASYGVGSGDMFLIKYKFDGTIFGCSSPMCQSQTLATVADPPANVSSPSATATSPSATVNTPPVTINDHSVTSTIIVSP